MITESGESVCFWTCEADLYTCAAGAGRSRGLVCELSVGAGVCRSCELYFNVFNPGSLGMLREK